MHSTKISPVVSRKEAAEFSSLSERTISRLIAAGTLESRMIGGRRLIDRKSLLRLLSGASS